jgi:glycosyltransferase involved in cell wall biosynthesis
LCDPWFAAGPIQLPQGCDGEEKIMRLARTDVPSPQISVAMATYNGEKHIRDQLDSIARQTLLPFELVITDDGSTDTTLQIVEDFSRTAPFSVRVIRNESRLGYANNFMKAASLCASDLIAFCDQDDTWMEHKLSLCSTFFGDPDVLLVAHSADVLLANGEHGQRHPDFAKTRIVESGLSDPFNYAWGYALMFRRVLLRIASIDYRPFKVRAHDQWFWFWACSAGKVATVQDSLTLYRQHASNTYGAPRRLRFAQRLIFFAQRLRRTAGVTNFDDLAESDLQCSSLLVHAAGSFPRFAENLKNSAAKLEFRAKLHRLRTRIYLENSNFRLRASTFSRILLSGGYFPDSSGIHLAPHQAMKDLFLGVTGIYRVLNSAARP